MSNKKDEFLAAVESNDLDRARAILESEETISKHAPDTITQSKGDSFRFTKKGKDVVIGDDGVWRLKK